VSWGLERTRFGCVHGDLTAHPNGNGGDEPNLGDVVKCFASGQDVCGCIHDYSLEQNAAGSNDKCHHISANALRIAGSSVDFGMSILTPQIEPLLLEYRTFFRIDGGRFHRLEHKLPDGDYRSDDEQGIDDHLERVPTFFFRAYEKAVSGFVLGFRCIDWVCWFFHAANFTRCRLAAMTMIINFLPQQLLDWQKSWPLIGGIIGALGRPTVDDSLAEIQKATLHISVARRR
jgi:hypothetical protein